MDVRFGDKPAYLESRTRDGKTEFYAGDSATRDFPLIPKHTLLVVLQEARETDGVVLTPRAARRAILWPYPYGGQMVVLHILTFGFLLGFLGYGISAGDGLIIVLSLAFLAAYAALHFYVRGVLLDHAQWVFARMPAPGTPIRVTSSGLTIASVSSPWTALQLVMVELRPENTVKGCFRCYIQTLQLAAPTGTIWLDAAAIGNGQQIVDTVFAKLYSPG